MRWTPPKLDADGLWEYAVKILAGRACSAGELRLKLQRKAERQSDIDVVIARLKDLHYLDDKRMGKVYVARAADEKQIPVYGQLGADVMSPTFTREAFGAIHPDAAASPPSCPASSGSRNA